MYCDTKKNCTGSFRTKGMECWHPVYGSSVTMHIHK
jgi:hypothetical protein